MNTLLTSISSILISREDIMTLLMLFFATLAFIISWAINRISILRIRRNAKQTKEISAIIQQTLDVGHNYVIKLDLKRHHASNIHVSLPRCSFL